MRSTLVGTALVLALMSASGLALDAAGQEIKLHAAAFGNLPESEVIDHSYVGPQWAAANYLTSAHVTARGHSFDPPFTEASANATFDQSRADGAVLRADGIVRQPYRGDHGQNPLLGEVKFDLKYELKIENLSGSPLNIVMGNDLHGRFAVSGRGVVDMDEVYTYFGPSGLDFGVGSIVLSSQGLQAKDLWQNTVSPTIMHDVVYGDVAGYQMNSFEYIAKELVASGTTIDVTIGLQFRLAARMDADADGGLAWYDFGNTGYLTTKAYDPVSGEDRSSEIRVSMVETPGPGVVGMAAVVGGWAIRRRRNV